MINHLSLQQENVLKITHISQIYPEIAVIFGCKGKLTGDRYLTALFK
ncbi:hypothetical protein GTQ43_14030 [Nostoc sp. KVJ3]|nr:hypothetical protein [Nostoc sp. KVJ3]MCW5314883.1 hypothetical protein [Nostoc sp. KVJ3]